jgi:putative FmdB family regulatory protein
MPTYEYKCANCAQLTEAFQKMSDAPLTKCPHCGKDMLERIVTGGAGVLYKGEGWYVTDYSKKSTGGKEPSADAKPAAKPADKSGDSAPPAAPVQSVTGTPKSSSPKKDD